MTTYKIGPNGYALYFHKGAWKLNARIKNSELEKKELSNKSPKTTKVI